MAKRNGKIRKEVATLSGLRREAHFAQGGNPVQWFGGKATTVPNKKREASRNACRRNSQD